MSEPLPTQFRDFKILQANLNGCYATQLGILESARDRHQWDMILLQEATRATKSILPKSFGYLRLACSEVRPEPGRHVSVCVYLRINNPLGTPEPVNVPCSCSNDQDARNRHDEHICTFAFEFPDGRRLNVTNIYNRTSESIPEDCLTSFLRCPGMHFVGGDCNLHHPLWAGRLLRTDFTLQPRTARIADKLGSHLLLLSPRGRATFHRGSYSSVLDLTWASPDLRCSVPRLLEGLETLAMDHTPLETSFPLDFESAPRTFWVWSEADQPQIRLHMKNFTEVSMALPLNTTSQILVQTEQLIATCRAVMTAHVPRKPRSPRALFRLRTPEIQYLRKESRVANKERLALRRQAEHLWQSLGRVPGLEGGIWSRYRNQDRKWRRLEQRLRVLRDTEFKKQWRSSFLKDDMSQWDWHRYAAAKSRFQAPAVIGPLKLQDPETGESRWATTPSTKVSALHKQWFAPRPPCADHDCRWCQSLDHHGPLFSAHLAHDYQSHSPSPPVIHEEVILAKFKKLRAPRAAGGDDVIPAFATACESELVPWLTRIVNACILLSYFPDTFKTGKTIAIPKPLKLGKSYNDPGMWRPICLLSIIGKIFESCLADLLAEMAQEFDMLPKTQMATRGRSTTTALLYLLEIIRTARKHGLAVSIMCLDQQGAFNHVQFLELMRVFCEHGIPPWLIALVESYLANRRTTIQIPGYESEPFPCGGVPQGSPMASILFNFFTCGLLKRDPSCEACAHKGLFKMAFSDDTYIIAIGLSLQLTKALLSTEFRHCQEWAHRSGARFNVERTEIIHFASPGQRDAPPMSDFIDGFDDELEVTTLKVLGVIIAADDAGNLSWNAHFDHLDTRAADLETDFRRIVKMTTGLDVISALQVYKACVRSALTYACAAWYEPSDDPWYLSTDARCDEDHDTDSDRDPDYVSNLPRRSFHARDVTRRQWSERLDKYQNTFLKIILGSFKHAPQHFRRLELHIERMDLYAYRLAVSTRANLIGVEMGDTILAAKNQVESFAQALCTRPGMDLRSRDSSNSTIPPPTAQLDTQAAAWRSTADRQVTKNASAIGEALPDRSTIGPQQRYEYVDDADDALAPAAVEAIEQFCSLWGSLEDVDDFVPAQNSYLHSLKRRIRTNSSKWADGIMSRSWSEFRTRETLRFRSMNPPRRIPAVLESEWGRHNLQRYKDLNRPVGSVFYQARVEYIGLNQHLREHGAKVSYNHTEQHADT